MNLGGKFFLNKVIEDNDVQAFKRHNIRRSDFVFEEDIEAYDYIMKYAGENEGNAPSYALISSEVSDFEYIPAITETYGWLAKQIKNVKGEELFSELFRTGKINEKFSNEDMASFSKWLRKQLDVIDSTVSTNERVGKSIKEDIDSFTKEYENIKEGKSSRMFPSSFSVIGKYTTGNSYVLYGKSGRGKSIIALREAVTVALAGYKVLYWGLELNWFEIMSRIYSILSGEGEVLESRVHAKFTSLVGSDTIKGGFNSNDLQEGKLDEVSLEVLQNMLKNINEYMEGDIIVRAVDDDDFNSRTLDDLAFDIKQTGADFVIIDPFYYLDYEENKSRKTGGDAEATSKLLKRMTGSEDVAILSLTQAEEVDETYGDDGSREIELPKRSEVTKTVALLQDSSLLIAVDTNYLEGIGKVGINKGRHGGEGETCNILFMPQFGVIKEQKTGIASVEGFDI